MKKWEPYSRIEIEALINQSESEMNEKELRLWNAIKVPPEKWKEKTYGNEGGGFWVVALMGKSVLWYNDIEEGFNSSNFNEYGEISEYYCNQDELTHIIRRFVQHLDVNEKA